MSDDVNVSIEVDIGDLDKKLYAMAKRSLTMLPLFPEAQAKLQMANAANFASNGLLTGGWAPLDAKYGAWKAARFPGAPPMVRTGKLFSSLVNLTNTATRATNTEFQFGTTVSYAKFHQMGTEKMPKRQIVFVPRKYAEWLGSSYASWVVEGKVL
jgi:phage gpG-like protein